MIDVKDNGSSSAKETTSDDSDDENYIPNFEEDELDTTNQGRILRQRTTSKRMSAKVNVSCTRNI